MRRAVAAGLIGTMLALRPATASACSCGENGTPADALAGADAVFVGRVAAEPSFEDWRPTDGFAAWYDVDVKESWKGVTARRVRVFTTDMKGDCGLFLSVGDTYLIYAYGGGKRPLQITQCSRTAPVSVASEDILFLRFVPRLPLFPSLTAGLASWAISIVGLAAALTMALRLALGPKRPLGGQPAEGRPSE